MSAIDTIVQFLSVIDEAVKFKKTITEEVVASVTNIVSNIKPHAASQPLCYHSRKSKGESSKQRIRKLQPLIGDAGHEGIYTLVWFLFRFHLQHDE
ncbi:unnamed protein product [Acanthoscelides obtectus]|uniref:Uncharacterized protein n=1 Tax=Acanthoscelides obtectus TaxID=200917 RepID=A0A9P0JW94_ACAOB|nr:unnamed protein product [Acanthoscelides obtectus]CAK1625334.1 hypothetical protein AOBTE_LOCUS3110 [Acanthoscelides obtectus]